MMVFCETKLRACLTSRLQSQLCFQEGFVVDCEGWRWGLALWWKDMVDVSLWKWKDMVDVSLWNYSRGHIDVMVNFGIEEEACFITRFYGHPKVEIRKDSRQLLRCIRHRRELP